VPLRFWRGHDGGWLRWEERQERACETVVRWTGAPRCHLDAIHEPERLPTTGSDTVEEGSPAIEKVVDVDYTHYCALLLSQSRVHRDRCARELLC